MNLIPKTTLASNVGEALNVDNMNPLIKKVEYAVRGAIPTRALELQKELAKGAKLPYDKVIKANIGDCHATGGKFITYIRQVLAACTYPELMKHNGLFPSDVKNRARLILDNCGSGKSLGSYSESVGIDCLRKSIANYISNRDGIDVKYTDIFASTGASDGIRTILKLVMSAPCDKPAGVMIPIPQYPLYTAALTEYNIHPMGYFLDEDNLWAISMEELERSYNEAKKSCVPRAIVVINPGNPTGQLLSKENIENIIKFAKDRSLLILADEVYQDNIYEPGANFISFRKVLLGMPSPYKQAELASFHSASKGFMGECGARAGYCQMENFDDDVKLQVSKLISTNLCPPVWGQVIMNMIVEPPKPSDDSYKNFIKEKQRNLDELKQKAELVTKLLNDIPGISCNRIMGAMYAFPRIDLPEKFIREAKEKNMTPDGMYCLQLLETTGICVVPGSGFGQKEGTYHFRTTILPQLDEIKSLLDKLRHFQLGIMQKYQ
ncbi:hypothetical protein ACOME3_007911 [Neoechinorhynchus agilis]